tara:strand:- start:1146 stop:1931 length:786 start_codon:yes stop_codon:yes gene_type:complete
MINKNIVGFIPARMSATRYPNKPMELIQGIPMVGHVYYRSKMANLLTEVYVATCDKEIFDYVESIGGKAIMTSDEHERASDRCAEALLEIESNGGSKIDLAIMIQGDEPMIMPEMINQVTKMLLEDSNLLVSNLMAKLTSEEDKQNGNNVKVVTDCKGHALYMSREAIPSSKKFSDEIDSYKQLGLIGFTGQMLVNFTKLKPTPLEIIESVDMNRVLEHGHKIKMAITEFDTDAVDIPSDLTRVNLKMKSDTLFQKYKHEN